MQTNKIIIGLVLGGLIGLLASSCAKKFTKRFSHSFPWTRIIPLILENTQLTSKNQKYPFTASAGCIQGCGNLIFIFL